MFKAVIFDRDGVILDSESVHINSTIYAFNKLGISLNEEDIDELIGKHPEDYKIYFLKKYSFSYEEFRKIQKEKYYNLLESTPFFDRIINLIKKLHSMNIPLAITTSGSKKSTIQILQKAGLEKVFAELVTFEDYTFRKPNPEPYLVTAKKLNVKPQDCLVFEDSSVGIEAAKRAEMRCIALPNEYTKKQDFSKADKIIWPNEKVDIHLLENF